MSVGPSRPLPPLVASTVQAFKQGVPLDTQLEQMREQGFADGQRDALRRVLDKLQSELMARPRGDGPDYDMLLIMTRWVAALRDTTE